MNKSIHDRKEDNPKKKAKIDRKEHEEVPNNPYMGLSLLDPEKIQENFSSYVPQHTLGKKFTTNDKEYTIRQIRDGYDENKETFLKKYVFVPSTEKIPSVYMDSAYEIDRLIDMKPIRERKGQPLGGKHKSHRRRRNKKSRKSRKSKKCRK